MALRLNLSQEDLFSGSYYGASPKWYIPTRAFGPDRRISTPHTSPFFSAKFYDCVSFLQNTEKITIPYYHRFDPYLMLIELCTLRRAQSLLTMLAQPNSDQLRPDFTSWATAPNNSSTIDCSHPVSSRTPNSFFAFSVAKDGNTSPYFAGSGVGSIPSSCG